MWFVNLSESNWAVWRWEEITSEEIVQDYSLALFLSILDASFPKLKQSWSARCYTCNGSVEARCQYMGTTGDLLCDKWQLRRFTMASPRGDFTNASLENSTRFPRVIFCAYLQAPGFLQFISTTRKIHFSARLTTPAEENCSLYLCVRSQQLPCSHLLLSVQLNMHRRYFLGSTLPNLICWPQFTSFV